MSTQNNIQSGAAQAPFSERLRHSKALIPTMAVLAVTTLALAATVVGQRSDARNGEQRAEEVVQSPQSLAQQEVPAKAAVVRAPEKAGIITEYKAPPKPATRPLAQSGAQPVACSHCGTVESVTTIRREGSVNGVGNTGIGVGAIGGAVVGGLLGHQVGGGNGKKAATVLGAVGGGYAGHAIEKNANSYTAYQMRVRMNDGSVRTIEQRSAVATGSQVTVEGNTLRVLPAPSAQS
ncbi:MAG TPA: glycine zipper 2TM domain-containing protein [Burkholderiaceae bacterium]|nr:glycine zipper 2TM domain-containing protein [Burkholderiaceae bacterium]